MRSSPGSSVMPRFPSSETTEVATSSAPPSLAIRSKSQAVQYSAHDRDTRIRIKNRRMRFLDLHPEYFEAPELELVDPLLYDRLVRRFQSADEREKEGRQRGYTGILEADLVRSEAKIEALQHPDPNSPIVYRRDVRGSIIGIEQDEDDRAQDRDDGWQRWMDVMRQRFMRGDDQDFDYCTVDDNDEYDDRQEEDRTRLEQYFEAEEAEFLGDGRPLGETGVQDF